MFILPFVNQPNDMDLMFKPVSQEWFKLESDEYITKEVLDIYSPIKFDILSIAINNVEKFKNFSSSQWEYSGYKQPDENTFNNAICFLASLPDSYLFYLNTDDIEPTPYGTFVLDFSNKSDLISIEIGKNKVGFYTKFLNETNSNSDGINFDADNLPKEIMDAFNKMLS